MHVLEEKSVQVGTVCHQWEVVRWCGASTSCEGVGGGKWKGGGRGDWDGVCTTTLLWYCLTVADVPYRRHRWMEEYKYDDYIFVWTSASRVTSIRSYTILYQPLSSVATP